MSKKTLSVVQLGAVSLAVVMAGPAHAAWEGYPGIHFKGANPGDADCIVRHSYSGVRNDCPTARTVVATVPVTAVGWYNTTVSVYGNNSWCRTTTVNGVGNGAHLGSATWTVAGPMTWQTLNTGSRYVWQDMSIVFDCELQSGGVIGGFNLTW
jgi:hypothetical protein